MNTLDRQADVEGLAFWTQQIQGGAATREQVIAAFFESLEHQILTLPSIEGGVRVHLTRKRPAPPPAPKPGRRTPRQGRTDR